MWLNKYPQKECQGRASTPLKTADPLVSTRFTPQTTTGNYCVVVASSSSSAFQLIDRRFFPGNHRRFIFFEKGKVFLRGRAISSQNTFLSTSFRTINGHPLLLAYPFSSPFRVRTLHVKPPSPPSPFFFLFLGLFSSPRPYFCIFRPPSNPPAPTYLD